MSKPVMVIQSRVWKHKITGATASIYGCHPDSSDPNWEIVGVGWTVANDNGTVGCGRKPWATSEEAHAYIDKFNTRNTK